MLGLYLSMLILELDMLACRKEKFLCKINQCDNYMLRLFRSAT